MSASPPIVNRHDVPARSAEAGDIRFERRRLGSKAGARRIGLSWFGVPAGARQMPVHQHGDEEEIFYVLAGSGLSWQNGEACAVEPGDVVVHAAGGKPHTFLAGDDGLELLAFSSGSHTHLTWLPRAQVMWAGPRWVPVDVSHPFEAEAAAGPLERPEPGERPPNVLALDAVDVQEFPGAVVRRVGAAAGSQDSGLNHAVLGPRAFGAPFHCHTLEEELYVILDGSGALRLGDAEHPVREGDVIARPPSTGVAHQLVAGDAGLTYVVYGTREPGDTTYYPDIGKVSLRGLGVTLDLPAT